MLLFFFKVAKIPPPLQNPTKVCFFFMMLNILGAHGNRQETFKGCKKFFLDWFRKYIYVKGNLSQNTVNATCPWGIWKFVISNFLKCPRGAHLDAEKQMVALLHLEYQFKDLFLFLVCQGVPPRR